MEGKTKQRLDGIYRLVTDPVIRQRLGRAGTYSTVALVLFGLITSAALPSFTLGETGSASANRLWMSGAELNTTTANVEITDTSGTVSISSSTKRSGDYAFRANPTSSTGTFYKTWANSTQSNKFWFRTYLRIADDPSADTYVMQIGSGGSGKISVRLTTASTLQLRNEEDNVNIGSASSALAANTWYRVEVYVDTTTLSSTDAELRLDGVSVGSSTAENLAAAIDRLTWGSSATGTTDLFFDDIAINDSTGRATDNWPGEGKIVHMQPDADGDNVAWTGYPNNTNDYDDIDEVTPNDNTDTNYETTNNDITDYNLESAASAGIGANDTIKVISVGARIQLCGQAPGGPACGISDVGLDGTMKVRIKASSGGTVDDATIGIVDLNANQWFTNDDDSARLNKLNLYDLPGTSTAPWTVADLNNAQIGVQNTDTNLLMGYNVTTQWLQVEYNDRSGGRMVSSGFELNSVAAGMEVSEVTNSPTINSATFRSGAYALETENAGGQEYVRFFFESSNSNNDYYARAYLRITTAFDGNSVNVMALLDTSNLRRAYIRLTTTNTLELFDEDGQIGSASSALSTGTWYRVELRMNTTPASGSHVVDARLDGTSFASASNRAIGTGVARLGLGVYASANTDTNSNTQGSLLWDDIALNKAIGSNQNTWPGAGAIIHLRPSADDTTNTAWTNGFANVDEVTPNDATDIISETTSGDIDDFELTDSSVGTSDIVNLVSVGVRFRTNTATQEDFRVRVKDAASGVAIESNTLSPASTTWTTNATADPKLYSLTAYTRPERDTTWQDAQLDSAQVGVRDVLSGTGTVEVTALWLLVDYSPPANILVSGTCDQFDQTTDCVDDGSNQIRVAFNGTLQAQVDTTVDGAWSISGVSQPVSGTIVTVFIDGETTDSEEAVAVAKYDGTGDITGLILFHRHLSIGSADNQTLTNTDLANYDNSVSADEDIFFDVSAGNDLTVDSLASYTDEELYIDSGDTFRPASGGGADVITVHVENDGTWTADSNAISVGGNWQNDSVFDAGTSTATFTATDTDNTLSGTMTYNNGDFYSLVFNGSGGQWSVNATLDVANTLTVTAGTMIGSSNITVSNDVTGAGTITMSGGTFEANGGGPRNFGTTSGSANWTFASLTFGNNSGATPITFTTQTGGSGTITVTDILRVGKSGNTQATTLNAGNRTWTLSGTGGDPLQLLASPAATLTASTSTFTYTGNNASGNTTVQVATYYNLDINNASETYVTEGNTSASNDITVTNGVLSTTGSNHSLTVTRDLTLANTAGVALTANASTITVSRHFTDTGDKYTQGTSTLIMAGTGTFTVASNSSFFNLHFGASTFTTTLSLNNFNIDGVLTFNGGTVNGGGGSWINLNCATTCTPVAFTSPTTLSSTRTLSFRGTAASASLTVAGGNYGGWDTLMVTSSGNNISYQLAGNVTTTGAFRFEAADGSSGHTFTTTANNYSITSSNFILGPCTPSRSGSWTVTLNASIITLSTTGDALAVGSNCGSHTLNMNSSSITLSGNVRFVNGTGTITVNPGTSTLTWVNTSGTRTYSPNGQSLYNVTLNGSGGTVQPDAAVVVTNDLTMSAGTLSGTQNITVNGTVQGTAGIINLTGGTFEQRIGETNENFGTTSGSTAWTFNDLTFSSTGFLETNWTITTQTGGTGAINVTGIMRINRSGGADNDGVTLAAGNRTWTLSGTSGDPLRSETTVAGGWPGLMTPGTSTFVFTGNNAGGNTTIEGNLGVNDYYNLTVNNASETYVLEIATGVGNDLNVTNGVLSTTASNYALSVTRDLILANTAGVGLTANASTITVSRNWSDPGNKFTEGTTSNVVLNGTGTIDEGGSFAGLSIAYSTKTSTFSQNTTITNGLTFNGGVATSSTTQTHSVNCSGTCSPVTFASATTLDSSGGGTTTLVFLQNASATMTVAGGNYGNWMLSLRANGTGLTSPVIQLGGNVTTTAAINVHTNATGTTTGATFNTQNYSITATTVGVGASGATNSWTCNFGSSSITATSTGTSGLTGDFGNHTWNLQTSSWSIGGDLSFASGASLVTVNPGTSTVTFAMTGTTETLTSGAQSLYNLTINSANSSRSLILQDAAVATGNVTITSGILDVNNAGNYSLTVGGNFSNSSTFTARTGTVTLNGSSTQTLSGTLTGSSAFYNLTVTNSSGTSASDNERTGFVASVDFNAAATATNNYTITTANARIEYNSGSTYTFTNINWNGQASGTRIYFRNSAVSGSWNLNVSGTQTAVSYVNVSRSNASSGNTIVANDGTNFDGSNNVNWNFTNPNTPTSLAQKKTTDTVISTGGWTNETSVKFTATASDTDSSDTLYLCVEKDLLGVGFSNTEDLCGTGVAYSGTPVTVTVTISGLVDTSEYHWQARVKDQGGVYSSWLSYGGNAESARDFGIDTTACTLAGTVKDGPAADTEYNDGSLTSLEANWDAFTCNVSGIQRYEYSIGTTAGGTDILTWTDNGFANIASPTGMNLRTNQRYFANVRATDNAGNVSSVYSSNGQQVLPTISLTLGATTVTFSNLNDSNNRTDTKTLNLTTSTNAYNGYVIRQYATGVLTSGSYTIPMFQGGTYASPASWPAGFCTSGSNCGYGYTSNDSSIQGSNKFSSGTLFASFSTTPFGDIVADHTANVTGATGPVSNQVFTISHKVSVDALQQARNYQTEVLYIVTGTF